MRLKKQLLIAVMSIVGWVSPTLCRAQFIGYTSPQTEQQTLATNLACTGSPQIFPVKNLGQTQHYLNVTAGTVPVNKFQAEIDGVDAFGNVYRISDVAENIFNAGFNQGQGSVSGTGYFPKIQIQITCSPNTGTFNATYSGAWGTFNLNAGSYLNAQIDKVNFSFAPGNANQTDTFQTPFGSSAGTIYFQYAGAVAGGTLKVTCNTNQFVIGSGTGTPLPITSLSNSNALQIFAIPDLACPFVTVNYISGGAAISVTTEYVFSLPGRAANSNPSIGSVTQGTTPWITQGTTSAAILSGQQAVTNSAAALASNALVHGICVAAASGNAASIFIGPSGVTTSTGLELPAKASTCLAVSNSNAIFVVDAAGGDTVTWVGN